MSIYIWDKEIKNLFVWWSTSISDMQWPCPDGFHVPLKSEWEALANTFTSLWIVWNQAVSSALKLPLCWYRSPNASRWSTSPTSRIWTSSGYTWDYSYYIKVYSNSFSIDTVTKATGCAIRPFKDSPKAPDSSRAVLYQWTWNAWVYHNSELWLISISSDWTNWITIADKNLWATTVYNYWDTYSQANCGNCYQRWNNYWFTYQWTVTTSTTQVNASTYWPWNYYESSTFIKRTSSPYKWDSSDNANLWWWVTQWTSEKAKEVKAVYLWDNKVRPSTDTRTFTISRTEQQDMSSWWTYSDDAAWLTAWDTAFDEFFWYYGCRLNTSGVETAKVTQEESWWAWKLDITQLWTLTSGDNVMIAFPVMWIKMSKSWSTVTLSITKELNKSWYQYYAHSTWTLSNPWTPQDVFYLGAYKWYSSSNVLKSWSGQSPTASQTQATFCTRAKANGSGYNIIWWYQRQFVNALYMMKYWNPDSQSVVWKWLVNWSTNPTTWWTNSQQNATYWTSSTSKQVKLFWVEDRWNWRYEWIWGCYANSSKVLYTMLTWWSWGTSWGTSTWTTMNNISWGCLSSIAGTNNSMFAPIATVNNTSYNTYYSDRVYVTASCLAESGGYWNGDSWTPWAFYIGMTRSTSATNKYLGSRLMYLNWLT